MQRFDRAAEPPPAALRGEAASRARRVLLDFMRFGEEKRSQSNVPRSEMPLEDSSMQEALNRLFRGRCAFCEAGDKISPYRFRPVAEAVPITGSEQAHLYYAWLENAWENIYAICSSCRPGEPSYFPVVGERAPLPSTQELERYAEENLGLWRNYPIQERSLFLDPCSDGEFYRSLWPKTSGLLVGRSKGGEATIVNFNLNATERVVARHARYTEYFGRLKECLVSPGSQESATDLFRFSDLEFGGTWYMLLRRLAVLMAPQTGTKPVFSPTRIQRFFLAMFARADTAERLSLGWIRLTQEDDNHQPTPAIPKRPGKARVTGVRLKNFKAIESLSITLAIPSPTDPIPDPTRPVPSLLILGENSAGKSSILEAIALALSDEPARRKLGLVPGAFVLRPTFLGGPDVVVERAEIEVILSIGAPRRLWIDAQGMVERSEPGADAIAVFAYGAFRQYQQKQRSRSPARNICNLFDASVLSNPERWLLNLEQSQFNMVVRALREILSIEGEFEVVQRNLEMKTCEVVTAVTGSQGQPSFARTPLSAVSSGFRSVLAMACDVMQGLMDAKVYTSFESFSTARGVILVDEVEAHLHPRWKMQIMRGLRRAFPQMTIIATTHDPLCLRGMEEGEVIVLQRVSAGDSRSQAGFPIFVEQLENLPDVSKLQIEQLLTSDFFQLHSTDAPETEVQMAQIGDLLAKNPRDLEPSEMATVAKFQQDIAAALPIGASETHRLVQEAVADYLKERRAASERRMMDLRQTAKARILDALRGV